MNDRGPHDLYRDEGCQFRADCAAFRATIPSLLEEHHGKWVVFRNGKIVSMHDDVDDAYRTARERYGLTPVVVAVIAEEHEHHLRLGLRGPFDAH